MKTSSLIQSAALGATGVNEERETPITAVGPGETNVPLSSSMSVRDPLASLASVLPLAAGLFLVWLSLQSANSPIAAVAGIAGALVILLAAATPILRYLQVGRISVGVRTDEMVRVRERNEEPTASPAEMPRAEEIVALVLRELEEVRPTEQGLVAGGDSNVDTPRARAPIGLDHPRAAAVDMVRERVARSIMRLSGEIEVLGRRINLNLVIGVLTTFGSLGVLGALVFGSDHTSGSIDWGYVVPRVSLAVFVEAFAYFFLRLYKSGLEDLKYYENEITNLEAWALAAEIALVTEDEAIGSVTAALASVERNFRLAKGESTVGLERERIQTMTGAEALESLAKAFKT